MVAGMPHDGGTEFQKFILNYFKPITIKYSKCSNKLRQSQRQQIEANKISSEQLEIKLITDT